MWLITPIGFFSIVQKPSDEQAGTLTVRARLRGDLDALKEQYLPGLDSIEESSDADYRFRASAPRGEVSAAMARLVDGLSYSNFKSEVAKRQGYARSNLYHDVWSVLYKLQTDPAFKEKETSADSYGGVVVSGGNRVLLREPTKHHGGYGWTLSKTEAKPGESPRDAAIRAVREKTGYEATIRISMPGLFSGSSSTTRYYVMDAKHPPARTGWQTARLRWVKFDEARELIRQSPNIEGRERDLAVLAAAETSAAEIPYKEHPQVQPDDYWNDLHGMPMRHTVLHPQLRYTAKEMEQIKRGFFPTMMEQKWFLYFTGDRLRMHRSWTGNLIFDVGFAFDSTGGASVTEVLVNRERDQYGNTDNEEDLKLVGEIIRWELLALPEKPPVDGFSQGLMLASKPNYLGSPEVVSGLVSEIFCTVIRVVNHEATAGDLQAVVSSVIAAFTDEEAGYTRMPDWHTAEQVGSYVKKYLLALPSFVEIGTLAMILSGGFGAVISKLNEMLLAFREDPKATWQDHVFPQLNEVQQYLISVLLGTNTLSFGERTLGEFRWNRVTTPANDEKQAVVRVGTEGGEVALVGIRRGEEWNFRVETGQSTLIGLLDEDDQVEIPERPWVDTWRKALKQLDSYPWHEMYPIDVHAEFRNRILKALKTRQKKGAAVEWSLWHLVLRIAPGKSADSGPYPDKTIDENPSHSLIDIPRVMKILNAQLIRAIVRRQSHLDGKTKAADAMSSDVTEMRALADLFNGTGDLAKKHRITSWNDPTAVGAHLRKLHHLDCSNEEAAFTVLMSALHSAYAEMDFLAKNMNAKVTEEAHIWRIEGIAEYYAYSLTGLPYPTDDE